MKSCVLYLRSSKDRSDVSISAQRRELTALAHQKGYAIRREYADVVESAKDTDRPAFQELLHDIKGKRRDWSAILLLDPSRLSRNQLVAHLFTQDCRKGGIDIVYAQMPDASPEVDIILTPMMHALAEYHSYQSKAKGLGGMRENVARGFRAGGRAPMGYRLQPIDTGTVREGAPVLKSRLAPNDDLLKMRAYLEARAANVARVIATKLAGLGHVSQSTLVCIEWQALTYAGCIVWGQHAERVAGGYVGGRKRRPRSEWVIQPDCHEAVITREQAETIIGRLEQSIHGSSRRTRQSDYLLTGLLVMPSGGQWHGDVGFYRAGKAGKRVLATRVESAVLAALSRDWSAPAFATRLLAGINAARMTKPDVSAPRREVEQVEARIRKLVGLVAEVDEPRAMLAEINRLEARRTELRRGLDAALHASRAENALRQVTPERLSLALSRLWELVSHADRDEVRGTLARLVSSITLDPATLGGAVRYALPVAAITGDVMASPRGAADIPGLVVESEFRVVAGRWAA